MLEQSAVTRGKWFMATAWAVVLASANVYGADLNTLRDLQVSRTGAGAQVVVTGTRPPTFTVFRLSGPERLVVDLSSADATGIKGHHDGTGPVSGVVAAQFSDARASVGRVLVALDQASQYDVRAEGNRVVISVDGSSVAPATVTAQAPKQAEPVAVAAVSKPAAVVTAAAPVQAAPAPVVEAMVAVVPEEGAARAAASQAPGRENVVATEADEREVAHPAQRITRLSLDGDALRVGADGDIARYEVLELVDPPRLAVDVYGVGLSAKAPKVKGPLLKDVRVGAHEDKVRLVLVARGDMPAYRVDRSERGLEVVLGAAVARKPKPSPSRDAVAETEPLRPQPLPVEAPKPAPAVVAQAAPQPQAVEVKDLSFDESASGGRVQLKLTGATTWKVDRPDPRSAVLTLDNARLPKKLERSLDTSALDTPVKMISAFSVPGEGRKVRVVVAADGAIEENVTQGTNTLSWRLDVQGVKTEEVAVTQRTAGFTAEAPAYAAEGAPQQ
ncbi:MAG: AMIN domain-containing protein, partial [Myxococcaceae bacterium]